MKTLGIMQPYLFPYIGYFQLIKAVDEYVIYDDIQFIKGGWTNRNNILIQDQKSLFTVALEQASPNKLINEISYKDEFAKFQKTLAMAYARAPHKEAVLSLVDRVCAFPDKNLARFNGHSLQLVADYLGLDTKFVYSSDLHKDNSLRAQAKVLAICEELGAGRYINAIGGIELYDRAEFKRHGIELNFLQPDLSEYKQFSNAFVPGLSIIDVMMFNAPGKINSMLDQYELI